MTDLTQELVQELFNYDSENGWLIHKNKKADVFGRRAGKLAWTTDRGPARKSGYRAITVKGRKYVEHRIVWTYFNGPPPDHLDIDHINRNKADNRIENLRLATRNENMRNAKYKQGKAGFRNVIKLKSGRFRATITLGTYATAEEAAWAAYEASKKLYGEFVTPEMYGLTTTPTCDI